MTASEMVADLSGRLMEIMQWGFQVALAAGSFMLLVMFIRKALWGSD